MSSMVRIKYKNPQASCLRIHSLLITTKSTALYSRLPDIIPHGEATSYQVTSESGHFSCGW